MGGSRLAGPCRRRRRIRARSGCGRENARGLPCGRPDWSDRPGAGGCRRSRKRRWRLRAADAELDPAAGLAAGTERPGRKIRRWRRRHWPMPGGCARRGERPGSGRHTAELGEWRRTPTWPAFALAPVQDKLARAAGGAAAERNPESGPSEAGCCWPPRRWTPGCWGKRGATWIPRAKAAWTQDGYGCLLARVRRRTGDTEAGRRSARTHCGGRLRRGRDPGRCCGACHTPHQEWAASCPDPRRDRSPRRGLVVHADGRAATGAGEARLPVPALRGE